LEAAYVELARIIDDAMRAIVEEAIATFDPHNVVAMVAAGDPAAFDAMHPAWQTIVDDDIAPILGRVYTDTALTAVLTSTAPPKVALNMIPVVNEAAVDYTRQATNRIVGAGQNLWTSVRSELTQAVQQGTSTEDLKSTIERITGYSEFRSDTIARTETLMAYNHGDNETARHLAEYGPVEKEWLATTDSRTRESHIEANGQVVKFDEDFLVGGNYMPFPGQGPPEETINCRCVTLHYYDGDPRTDGSVVGEDDDVQAAPSASDSEVIDFINEALANNPNMTTQELLDAYKATGRSVARQRFYGLAREAKGGSRAIGPSRGPIAKAEKKVVAEIEKRAERGAYNAKMADDMEEARRLVHESAYHPWDTPLSERKTLANGQEVRVVSEHARELNRRLVNVGEEVEKRAKTYTKITRDDLDGLMREARRDRYQLRDAPSYRREEQRLISERSQKAYEAARASYEDAQRKALAEVRDMGNGEFKMRGTQKTAMKSAAKEYPTERVERLPEYKVGKVQRGYHNGYAREIMLSGDTPNQVRSTAVHEIGHGMETTVPGMRQAEHSFYWERAQRDGYRTWDYRTAKGIEQGMEDKWYDKYAGRSYGGTTTSPYEVLTMGVEQMFGGWQGRLAGGMMDAEYERWLLGVMATL
jgi:SPP1 gp7 family putative phage head morphogenesis protein